jgi:hypothetical protein
VVFEAQTSKYQTSNKPYKNFTNVIKFKTEVRVLQKSTESITELCVSGNCNYSVNKLVEKNYCVYLFFILKIIPILNFF